jgi:Dyp-type peroxidase family
MTSGFRRYSEGISVRPGRRVSSASHAGVRDDVVLETDEIQGNVLEGFNKPFQSLLCLKIEDPRIFRWRLGELAPRIASATEVLAFNRLYKSVQQRQSNRMRSGRLSPVQPVKATWVNIAFSYAGLRMLTNGTNLELTSSDDFQDESFRLGLKARSKQIGDPTTGPGSTREWVVGGDYNEAHALIIIASDDRGDLGEEVIWWRNELERYATIIFPGNLPRYIRDPRTLFREDGGVEVGAKLKEGKEHFGYRDGISQPGLRGSLSRDSRDVLTPRQNPSNEEQGLPGQDLVWPGEFVFGYPTQVADDHVSDGLRGGAWRGLPHAVSPIRPKWAVNGSFLVFRRLTQDVHAFHSFLQEESKKLNLSRKAITGSTAPADWLGARLVGRWQSGAPVSRARDDDMPRLGENELENNNFGFQAAASLSSPGGVRAGGHSTDNFQPAQPDPAGLFCPFAAHIRTVNSREADTQTHRLLRRGIPFGKASTSTPTDPQSDNVERGLYFLAYQTSIVRQFEYVTTRWANDPNFKEHGAGYDPIIGQNGSGNSRNRFFNLSLGNGEQRLLEIQTEWVTPTGGGYFFSPSIGAIQRISRGM